MSLFIMCADAEGGGSNYFLVAADNKDVAYNELADMRYENIGCVASTPNEIEYFVSSSYTNISILGTV